MWYSVKNKVIFSFDYKVLNDEGNQNGKESEQHEDDGGTLLVAEAARAPAALHAVSAGAGWQFCPLRDEEHRGAVGTDEVLVPHRVLALANGTHTESILTVQLKAGKAECRVGTSVNLLKKHYKKELCAKAGQKMC